MRAGTPVERGANQYEEGRMVPEVQREADHAGRHAGTGRFTWRSLPVRYLRFEHAQAAVAMSSGPHVVDGASDCEERSLVPGMRDRGTLPYPQGQAPVRSGCVAGMGLRIEASVAG